MAEDVVRTRRLEIVDREDRPRIVAEVSQDGTAHFSVTDAYGRSRVRIQVPEEGMSMIAVTHPTNDVTVSLFSVGDKGGLVVMQGLDEDRIPRVYLTLEDDRTAHLLLSDEDALPRVLLEVEEDGTTTVEPQD